MLDLNGPIYATPVREPDAGSILVAAAIRDRRARRRRRSRRVRTARDADGWWYAELSTGLSAWGATSHEQAIAALVRLIEYRESVVDR